jgi:glucose-1-phosphate thymidylyltransferase
MKIIIPMAGFGKRLLPLTRHKPKALIRLAEKRLLDHVLDTFQVLEKTHDLEYIFIIGYLGEQIKEYVLENHPDKNVTYFVQEQLQGQSHAVYLAKHAISGPVLLTYCDTINEIDLSFLPNETMDGVVSVLEVDDPRSHGVAMVDSNNLITKLVEKPKTMEHKSVLTGLYYFSDGKTLISAIETQIQRNKSLNNEYYLADAINILVENGLRIRTQEVTRWLDAGTPETVLGTNTYMLQHRLDSHNEFEAGQSNVFIHPTYIHKSSRVENSIIGPNVAIGKNCSINGSILKGSIVDDNSNISNAVLINSLIGRDCKIGGKPVPAVTADNEEMKI